ncbi:MaoC/PaaZ C-terminal domain-containing protein [Mycolicibacterium neoaurum]|uniref:MaoC/PaaZ C-terminal domain-containing protein n=1 Tax=Mycolicibacterium neoaurum TaxID=1795 RepID=UPI00248AAF55|nr:MaoC/PaaZ C-terminal domain-containing protein [Mycolicibacterium neoaurum]WBP93665.1 MaoC/PaaZ C-terminal domain-containing protein [Mycolicibacterium neoaurum]WBS07558.1 MaoC/PaaZ C-terminal domain-containing protein [Mycolicibacterium neoaurum]
MPDDLAPARGRDLGTLDTCGPWYAEDLRAGDHMKLGSVDVTRQAIIEFATKYDPLDIHIDGTGSPFGDIIASGVHTMALFSSMASRHFIPRLALIAGRGIDRMRLPHPVLPGSRLFGHITVTAVVPTERRADLVYRSTMVDQSGRAVLDFSAIVVTARR